MRCSSCGADNPSRGKFCIECGKPLNAGIFCGQCGRELPRGSKFCGYCGAKVRGGGVAPSPRVRKVRRGVGAPRGDRTSRRGIVAFAILGALVLAAGGFFTWSSSSRSRNLNAGSGASIVWAAEVQEVAANFNCPCGKCGVVRLDLCTCDIPRGAVEVKSYIQSLLNQGLSRGDVIRKVEERYGNRI
ncbi:MAG: double zinc ribbon domain-containing protein [bacterium]